MPTFLVDDIMSNFYGIIVSQNMHLLTSTLLVSFTSGNYIVRVRQALAITYHQYVTRISFNTEYDVVALTSTVRD